MSREVKRPELLAVEVPFTLTGNDHAKRRKALGLLGGQKTLDKSVFPAEALQSSTPLPPTNNAVTVDEKDVENHTSSLKLWLQPESPLSHSLVDSTLERNYETIVLRVRRSRKSRQIHSARVVGFTDQRHTFNNLCDFVYRPASMLEKTQIPESAGLLDHLQERLPEAMSGVMSSKVSNPYGVRKSLYVPPAYFAPSTPYASFDFSDEIKTAKSKADGTGKLDNAEEEDSLLEVTLDNAARGVPKKKPSVNGLSDVEKEHVAELEKLFQQQPCWMKDALVNKFGSGTDREALKLLYQVCYKVKTGPFGTLLIRYGFDPRVDRSSSMYQTIMYRLDKSMSKLLEQFSSQKAIVVSGIQLRGFNRVQLCEIRDNEIRQICKDNVEATCHPKYGWFSDATHNRIRARLYKLSEIALEELKRVGGIPDKLSAEIVDGDAPPFDPKDWTIGPPPEPAPEHQQAKKRRKHFAEEGLFTAASSSSNLRDKSDSLDLYDAYVIPGEDKGARPEYDDEYDDEDDDDDE